MIFGRGTAQTDKAILAEFTQFIDRYHPDAPRALNKRRQLAPSRMQARSGKTFSQWSDDDILNFYAEPETNQRIMFSAFISFLFLHGYRKCSPELLMCYPGIMSRTHTNALKDFREKFEQAHVEIGYHNIKLCGSELNLLIALLLLSGKTLEEITWDDFRHFQTQSQVIFKPAEGRKTNVQFRLLSRLENYLIWIAVLPPVKKLLRHEVRLAKLKSKFIIAGLQQYLEWSTVRDAPSTVVTRRNSLLDFFLWLQEHYPECQRLDDVSRPIALSYAKYLHDLRDRGERSWTYCNDLYRYARMFYEFAIQEQLETAPHRNPFGLKDVPTKQVIIQRYLIDHEVRKVLTYCENGASLKERTVLILLLHTGVRASELADLSVNDIVEIQGKWKLHIREGKGLKDRLVPLTAECLATLERWKKEGWEACSDRLFTRYSREWQGYAVGVMVHNLGLKLGIEGLSPHRFRHTFAVTLLNYGMRETALQKIMGHTTLNMTLHYARILDDTVEKAFSSAVEQMQDGPLNWVPSFLATEDYQNFVEADSVSWIRLPLGFCRRNPKLHCESDVKCLLCERFKASAEDLPKLRAMHERFVSLGLQVKADVVASQIRQLESQTEGGFVPLDQIGINL